MRQHLPGVALPDAPAISLTHLLQHSSGLPDDAPLFPHTPEGKLWSAFAPGSAWSYSNTGYLILGRIIERADGRSLAESLQRRIFSPLGMPKAQGRIMAKDRALYTAGYSPRDPEAEGSSIVLDRAPWINVTSGAGCVAATSRDMAAWLRFLLAAGAGHGAGLLSDDQARAYAAPGIAAPGWSAPGSDVGPATYGSGLAHVTVEGRSLLHHTGGMLAYSSAMHVDPVAGVACFASTNMGGEGYRPRDITAYACARLRSVREPQAGLSPQPRAIKPLRPAAATAPIRTGAPDPALAALTGRYETDDPWTGAVTITCAGDRLMLDGDVALEQSPQGYWTPKGALSTERLWFLSLAQGRPQVLSLSGRLLERRDL